MKKSKKIVILLFVLISICGCGKKEEMKQGDTPKEEIKEPIESKMTLSDFQIELKSNKIENGTSEFTFEITNISKETKYVKEMQAKAKDGEGNNVVSLLGVIEQEIGTGEKVEVNCSYGGDLSLVQSFEYELVK